MSSTGQPKSLRDLGLTATGGDVPITGIAVDSRAVKDGYLFAALPGVKAHGAQFIEAALQNGASAILTDRQGAGIAAKVLADRATPVVLTEDPRQALAYTAALWFGRQPEVVVAVTGTNGKTSVASFTQQIWSRLGLPAVNIGTTGVEGALSQPSPHTTPEPVTLHRILAEVADEGIDHAAMEASSHGLAQKRLDGVRLAAAAFTNLTQDHLDYHPDLDSYFAAKAGLFDRVLGEDGVAVINIDDPRGRNMTRIAEERGQDIFRVGRKEGADLRILSERFDTTGQMVRFSFQGETHQARLELIGGFQAENVMLAAALVVATGCNAGQVFQTLPDLVTVRGRMQLVATRDNGAAVFVDFAHTPDALATALAALRPHVMGDIVVVYGAGGDRDRTKRPLMGAAARDGANVRIVTDDNPRSEDPAEIRSAILKADPDAIEVADRAEAILRGVDMLGPGDALLIAGKGHETGQVVGDTTYPFDDAEQASLAVAALDGHVA